MSAGGFVSAFYETDDGNICPISVQPETLEFTAGNVVNELANVNQATVGFPSATVSGSRRGRGRIYARTVRLRLVDPANPPAGGYVGTGILRIPIVSEALYDAISKGSLVTYLNFDYRVVGKTEERIS